MLLIGRGKVKGMYRNCRKEFLRARGNPLAIVAEAEHTLHQLGYKHHVTGDEPWIFLITAHVRTNRMWGQLTIDDRNEIVNMVRMWSPVVPEEVLTANLERDILYETDLLNQHRREDADTGRDEEAVQCSLGNGTRS